MTNSGLCVCGRRESRRRYQVEKPSAMPLSNQNKIFSERERDMPQQTYNELWHAGGAICADDVSPTLEHHQMKRAAVCG
jgi:hypothetical protein